MAEIIFPLQGKRAFVAGETGLVGRALVRALQEKNVNILSAPRTKLDLTDQRAVFDWIASHKPDVIFLAAARVGGIGANNDYPADFIRDNLSIAQNVIDGAHRASVPRLVFFGSSCIYPRDAVQPIREETLMTGSLERTNEAYAIAKIAGLKMCEFYHRQYGRNYISLMPTNLYGPYDRFDEDCSHVIPAMMMKFLSAVDRGMPYVTLWGTGTPQREFLHVDDLASAAIHTCETYNGDTPINIGSGEEVSIKSLSRMMAEITGFKGKIVFDTDKPDGTPRKYLDSTKIRALGWAPKINLEEGLRETFRWYRGNLGKAA